MRIMTRKQEERLNKLVELANREVPNNGSSLVFEALHNLNRCIYGRIPTLEEVIHYILDYKNRTRDLKNIPKTDACYWNYIRAHYMQ